MISKKQTPLLPLGSLDEEIKYTPDYTVPQEINEKFTIYQEKYDQCRKEKDEG